MKKYIYYPGCTLKTKAKQLDEYGRRCLDALGVEFDETDWQCCGAVYPVNKDEIAQRLSSLRVLSAARDSGADVLTLCSACHHVFKRVNEDVRSNDDIRMRANNYMELQTPYTGESNVIHYLELLRDVVGFDELKKQIKNPLKGRKIAAFYGCMLLRPSKVMQFDDPENPRIMEDFIRALGAEPVMYPYRNECCGSYGAVHEGEIKKDRV